MSSFAYARNVYVIGRLDRRLRFRSPTVDCFLDDLSHDEKLYGVRSVRAETGDRFSPWTSQRADGFSAEAGAVLHSIGDEFTWS